VLGLRDAAVAAREAEVEEGAELADVEAAVLGDNLLVFACLSEKYQVVLFGLPDDGAKTAASVGGADTCGAEAVHCRVNGADGSVLETGPNEVVGSVH
jgi:hypothetical protein